MTNTYKWREVKAATVFNKLQTQYPFTYRLRFRYYERSYGTEGGISYSRKTRLWYKPIEFIANKITIIIFRWSLGPQSLKRKIYWILRRIRGL